MKSIRRLAAPCAAAFLVATASAFAQPNPLAAPMEAREAPMNNPPIAKAANAIAPLDEANWRAIRVKNVRPSTLAYQIDPVHNKMPAFWNVPYGPAWEHSPDYKKPEAKSPFDLPSDVRLAGSDEQKLLFVAGADEQQIARVQELVDVLDQSIRFVEIEAQVVEVPVAALSEFGIELLEQKDAKSPPFKVVFVRPNFQESIAKLVEAGQAKTLSTQPLTIGNNYSRAVSLLSGPIDNTGANQNKRPIPPNGGRDTVIALTPTINGDDTITVLMNIQAFQGNTNPLGLLNIANLRDGQTIALTGLLSSAFPYKVPMLGDIPIGMGLFRSKTVQDERTVLIFVTARIVRDAEK